ncbi:hypothetical protein GCM10022243_15490 [Saccharothrix violaceirubra]
MDGEAVLGTVDLHQTTFGGQPRDGRPRRLHRDERVLGAVYDEGRRDDLAEDLVRADPEDVVEECPSVADCRGVGDEAVPGDFCPA